MMSKTEENVRILREIQNFYNENAPRWLADHIDDEMKANTNFLISWYCATFGEFFAISLGHLIHKGNDEGNNDIDIERTNKGIFDKLKKVCDTVAKTGKYQRD